MTSAEFAGPCIDKPSDRNPGVALHTDNGTMDKADRAELWTKFQTVSVSVPARRSTERATPTAKPAGRFRIAAPGVSTDPAVGGSLAHGFAAAAACLAEAGVPVDQVDLLINAGVYRDQNMFEPAMAALIQKDLGLCLDYAKDPAGHAAFSFDLMNSAAGVLGAVQAAGAWLASGSARYALVVTSDAHPAGGDYPYATVGAAMLLERTGGGGFGPFQTSAIDREASAAVTGFFDLAEAGTNGRAHLVVDQEPGYADRLLAFAAAEVRRYAATHDVDLGETLLVTSQPTPGFAAALAKELGLAADAAVTVTGVEGDPHSSALTLAWHQAAPAVPQALFVAVGAGPTATCALYRSPEAS